MTLPVEVPPVESTGGADPDGPARLRTLLETATRFDRFAVIVAALGLVSIAPGFYFVSHPRFALVLAGVPVGLVALARLWRARDVPAIAAGVVLAAALVSTLLADRPWRALLGTVTEDTSLIVLIAVLAWWAIGRHLSADGVALLPIALTMAVVPNVAIGLLQLFVEPPFGIYAASGGRASGLLSNPVYFASVVVGVWAYWLVRSHPGARWSPVVAGLLAFTVGISGSRGAVAGALVVATVFVVTARHRAAVVAAVASTIGFGLGLSLLTVLSSRGSERFEGPSGLGIRVDVWRTTISTWAERPLFGHGFDPYLHALNERLSDAYTRDHPYRLWTDPHNVFLLLLVSLGIVGLLTIVGFVILSLRGRTNWALGAAFAALVLSWMLQPTTIHSWPLAFLILGAATRPDGSAFDGRGPGRSDDRVAVASMVTGGVLAVVFLAWSLTFAAVLRGDDPDRAERVAAFMMRDPDVARTVAVEHQNTAASDAELDRHLARAEELAVASIRDGGDPNGWIDVVEIQIIRNRYRAAYDSALDWVELRPSDPFGYRALVLTASLTGESDSEQRALDRLCELDAGPCDG